MKADIRMYCPDKYKSWVSRVMYSITLNKIVRQCWGHPNEVTFGKYIEHQDNKLKKLKTRFI